MKLEDEMDAHAVEAYPEEACGVVLRVAGVSSYHRMKNVHPDPTRGFRMDPAQYFERGELAGVFHSHPDGNPYPSLVDMRGQVETDVPWRISVVRALPRGITDSFWWGRGRPHIPLLGRPFRHGVTDCYALVRDYYEERGVLLPEYPRSWRWWKDRGTLYADNLGGAGFHPISDGEVREGDMCVAQIHSPTPNHAGVYLGRGLILHHISGGKPFDRSRLSARAPISLLRNYGPRWYRHRDLETVP